MQDRFGVPDSMFGSVPEDFYAVVGRIVLVATMVEDRTLMVLWALDDATQDTHAGRSASDIRREVATRATKHAAVLGDDLVSHLGKVLADLTDASARRNALVHSLWPNPTEELAQGWAFHQTTQRGRATLRNCVDADITRRAQERPSRTRRASRKAGDAREQGLGRAR